jgi:hypothetical protein
LGEHYNQVVKSKEWWAPTPEVQYKRDTINLRKY